jgi:hypothetical protein
VGYPYEAEEDVGRTIKFIKNNEKHISNAFGHRFALLYDSPIYAHPASFGIDKSSPLHYAGNIVYKFNESNGLKWVEKSK